jgi:hypothetical protein
VDWEIRFIFSLPHQRVCLGWEVLYPTDEFPYQTLKLYLLLITIELDYNVANIITLSRYVRGYVLSFGVNPDTAKDIVQEFYLNCMITTKT